MTVKAQSGRLPAEGHSAARGWFAGIDRPAWRRFFLAIFALTLALFLALYATGLGQSGQYKLAAIVAAVSLLLTALVAVRIVPGLARRMALNYWMAKVEYEFTREGLIYLAMIAVITVAALNTGNNLLFIILSCLLAAVLASGVLSRIVLRGLEIDLAVPDHIFSGQSILARLRLENRKLFWPTFSVTISGRAVARSRRKRPAITTPSVLSQNVYFPYIPRRSSASQNVTLTFPKRGNYSQTSLRISTRFPFGFIRKTQTIPCSRDVLVLPSVQPYRKYFEVLPHLGNELDSYLKGRSHDLYAIRDYEQNDSARHVDWKATARVRQLKVREFTREDERRMRLVFDPRVSDLQPETLERFEKAVQLCACLAWHFYKTRATLSFVTAGFETPMAPAGQTLYAILEKLALVEPMAGAGRASGLLPEDTSRQAECFQVILTDQSPESIPAGLRRAAYFIFMDSL
ncbi:MAG TPA: DUF58 domain-containing protein [Terriglobia bacterium]|nr:DUF58 domain-containing protein [Terriglobia bacterium]